MPASVPSLTRVARGIMSIPLTAAKHLEVEDASFPGAGMIGPWSWAEAHSYFDDLTECE